MSEPDTSAHPIGRLASGGKFKVTVPKSAMTTVEPQGGQDTGAWQSIETAPKDGSWVLLRGGEINYGWDGDTFPPVVVGQFAREGNVPCWQFAWYDSGYYGEYENPTEWRPLP